MRYEEMNKLDKIIGFIFRVILITILSPILLAFYVIECAGKDYEHIVSKTIFENVWLGNENERGEKNG